MEEIRETPSSMIHRKLALVSHTLPPAATVLTEVICRLFDGLSDHPYCLIRSGESPSTSHGIHAPCTLGRTALEIHRSPLWRGRTSRIGRFLELGMVPTASSAVRSLARSIADITSREGCQTIVTFSGDLLNLPAVSLACSMTGADFVPILVDDYVFQWRRSFKRQLAERWARRVFSPGQTVIVPNEFLADALSKRYPADPTVIRNPCHLPPPPGAPPRLPVDQQGEISIAFTGSIYSAHYDSFRILLRALDEPLPHPTRLHLYSNQTPNDLAQVGLEGPIIHHGFVPNLEIPQILREAHILYLGLAFNPPEPEIVRTASPGKMGDYFASGTPVLVHAPEDSFVSWYCRTHGCGLVVDQPDQNQLADAIRRLSTDTSLRQQLSESAYQRAREDFALPHVRQQLIKAIESDVPPSEVPNPVEPTE